jgi:hypothetical protein
VVNAVEREGMSRRAAAARFGIGIKTAIDWVHHYRETGRLSALASLAPRMIGHCDQRATLGLIDTHTTGTVGRFRRTRATKALKSSATCCAEGPSAAHITIRRGW